MNRNQFRPMLEQLEDRDAPSGIASNNGVTFCVTTPPPVLIPLVACETVAAEHGLATAAVSGVVTCICE
jgi:hypothetical protein